MWQVLKNVWMLIGWARSGAQSATDCQWDSTGKQTIGKNGSAVIMLYSRQWPEVYDLCHTFYQNGTDGVLVLDLEISTAERLRCLKWHKYALLMGSELYLWGFSNFSQPWKKISCSSVRFSGFWNSISRLAGVEFIFIQFLLEFST